MFLNKKDFCHAQLSAHSVKTFRENSNGVLPRWCAKGSHKVQSTARYLSFYAGLSTLYPSSCNDTNKRHILCCLMDSKILVTNK